MLILLHGDAVLARPQAIFRFFAPPDPQIILPRPSQAIPDHSGKNPEKLPKFRPTRPRYPDISVPLPTPGTKPGPESTLACDSLPGDALKILFEAMRVSIRPVTLFWASHWRRAPQAKGPWALDPSSPSQAPMGLHRQLAQV